MGIVLSVRANADNASAKMSSPMEAVDLLLRNIAFSSTTSAWALARTASSSEDLASLLMVMRGAALPALQAAFCRRYEFATLAVALILSIVCSICSRLSRLVHAIQLTLVLFETGPTWSKLAQQVETRSAQVVLSCSSETAAHTLPEPIR